MASLAYARGVTVTESTETPVLPRWARFGVVGIAGTANDADPNVYPLNKPVLMLASRFRAGPLGSSGTLPRNMETLYQEGASHVVVVRAEEVDGDPVATKANIIGSLSARTGLYAFLNAEDLVDLRPRILIAPGFTNDFVNDGVVSASITDGGSGYTNASAAITGGDGTGVIFGDPVIEAGAIVSIPILAGGGGYSTGALAITGDGTGAAGTLNFGDVMNPVVQAMAAVANDRGVTARAYVDGPGTTDAEAVAFRNTINNGRVMVIDPTVLQYDPESGTYVQRPGSTVFAGIRSRVATETNVSESVSNKEIRSIVGVSRTIRYGDEANYLTERQISTFIKYRGGFRTWGSRLCADQSIWQFDSVRATADFINETLHDTIFEFVDRKFSKANLKFLIESVNAILRLLKANGDILGGRVSLDGSRQTDEDSANGRVWISVTFEPPAVMEDIRVITHRDIAYYSVLLDEVNGLVDEFPFAQAA